jgi:hypothetical protein
MGEARGSPPGIGEGSGRRRQSRRDVGGRPGGLAEPARSPGFASPRARLKSGTAGSACVAHSSTAQVLASVGGRCPDLGPARSLLRVAGSTAVEAGDLMRSRPEAIERGNCQMRRACATRGLPPPGQAKTGFRAPEVWPGLARLLAGAGVRRREQYLGCAPNPASRRGPPWFRQGS